MTRNRLGWSIASALGILVTSAAPRPAYADPAAEFRQLMGGYSKQYAAANYSAAERSALEMRKLAEGPLKDDPTWLARALVDLAAACRAQKRYAEAEPLYDQALAIREKALGPDHLAVSHVLNQQGLLYWAQKRYAKAEPLYKRALAIREKALGPEHRDVAQSLDNLALLYTDQKRFQEAEPLCKRALAIREKVLAPQHADVALSLHNLAWLCQCQKRFAEAEPLGKRAVAIREKALGPEHPHLALTLYNLALVYQAMGRPREAEPLFSRALAIREKRLGPEHRDLGNLLNDMVLTCEALGRYGEAESLGKRALAIREKSLGPDHVDTLVSVSNLAFMYYRRGRYAEAEPLFKRSLAALEKVMGPDDPVTSVALNNLAELYDAQGRYPEAEPLLRRALAIREKTLGAEHAQTITSLNNLGTLYYAQGRYAQSEPLLRRVVATWEKALGPDHPNTATSLSNLASFYGRQGRYAEAEPLLERALRIREKVLGPEHPDVPLTLSNLGDLCQGQGRYAEAEVLYKRALGIWEKALGPEHPNLAVTLNNLARAYYNQARDTEAMPLFMQALAIRVKALGRDHPSTAETLNNLALVAIDLGRYADAEQWYQRVRAVYEKVLGPENPQVALTFNNLGYLYYAQSRYADAEKSYRRALATYEKAVGPEHIDTSLALNNLALVCFDQARYADAERLIDRAMAIRDRHQVSPADRFYCYSLRAKIHWKGGRKDRAIADLKHAMDLAEQQRGQSGGAEHLRARFFATFASAFETMVAWQHEQGNLGEALAAMERGRARSLLDQLETQRVDLLAGVPKEEADKLRQRQRETQSRVTGLEKQWEILQQRKDLSPEAHKREAEALEAQLQQARIDYVAAYADIRNASPAYRLAVGQDRKPVSLEKLQEWIAGQNALLIEYLLGAEGGYVLVVPSGGKPRLEKLSVSPQQAEALGTEAGPLTAARLEAALGNKKGTGVLQQLKQAGKPALPEEATRGLAALWELLVPQSDRTAILGKKVKRVIVIPDGALAQVPFEALVVKPVKAPQYLLDVGLPIEYAPSATVLVNLAQRASQGGSPAERPVLTVGNARYGEPAATSGGSAIADLGPRSRYRGVGGSFAPLPYSAWEIAWVADAFGASGMPAFKLEGDDATEANVRSRATGRRVVHLACHGRVDQIYGNLFGALVLTPGPRAAGDPGDDGVLTLAEVYQLEMSGCELAILSACDTNFGPEQRGEGVCALSRGFLVAGSRRVVASNWLVDDEAAASLVGHFCSRVAQGQQRGEAVDYAEALHNAKLWIRQQEKWSSPYFWSTFVLVGPN